MGLYIVASYKESPIITRIANLFLTGAVYLAWYSFCTNSWGRTFPQKDKEYFVGYGIWRIGDNNFKSDEPNATTGSHAPIPKILFHSDGWLSEWYWAFQAFTSFGFVSVNLGYFLLILIVYVGPCKSNADLVFWNAINNIAGCISWLVAVLLFGLKFKETFDNSDEPVLHYSFYLAVVVCAFQLITGILLFLSKRKETVVQTA
ncbi:hypothetical protein ACOMHN_063098 [Nucella lapillus]